MTHTSPTTFAVWSVLSTALGAFLLGHLWRFDKFKCLKWSNAPYSGAFKRIMTYTYLITIPLIMTYSFGFTVIKYKEGFLDVGGTIIPKPYTFWSDEYRSAIFPLMMFFSFAWSFEMVTHLEELCFWYFLITAGPAQPDWFHSVYFRIWVGGSIAAMIYLPAVTISFRDSPLRCEARMFFSGSFGDLILTLAFIPILYRFPGFIRKVKAEVVDPAIVIRLRKFYELNVIRIIFRFLMQIPLLSLGVDGLKPHNHELNESIFWTDMLSIIAALGCAFSSVCTLLIFFPRSYEAEYHSKEASHRRSIHSITSRQSHEPQPAYSQYGDDDHVDFDRSFHGKSGTLNTPKLNEADDNDLAKYEGTDRKMDNGFVKERPGTKMRGREKRIAKGAKKIGVELQDVLQRRFARLSLGRRRRMDPEGSSGNSLGIVMPSLSQEQRSIKDERDTLTRRTTPSARGTRRERSGSSAIMSEEGRGASLERKSTYLLTNSPVLHEHGTYQQEWEGGHPDAAVSTETLEAAYEVGTGMGAVPVSRFPLTTSPVEMHETDPSSYDIPWKKFSGDIKEPPGVHEDEDIPSFALDTRPTSSSVPPYSQATGLSNISPVQTSPTHGHIYGPRPIKKSMSVSTTATAVTRRALPTPPVSDPLGAAPSYSPPSGPLVVSALSQIRSKKQTENSNAAVDINAGLRMHPFASASAPLDRQDMILAHRPTNMRETNDGPPVTISSQPDMLEAENDVVGHLARSPHSRMVTAVAAGHGASSTMDLEMSTASLPGGHVVGLTVANLLRLNSTTRSSQVNPLVRTFTSPIDFLDRIQEAGGSGSGSGAGANASRVHIGWAV